MTTLHICRERGSNAGLSEGEVCLCVGSIVHHDTVDDMCSRCYFAGCLESGHLYTRTTRVLHYEGLWVGLV